MFGHNKCRHGNVALLVLCIDYGNVFDKKNMYSLLSFFESEIFTETPEMERIQYLLLSSISQIV